MHLKPHALFLGMVSISATLHMAASVAPWPQSPPPEEALVGDSALESAIDVTTTSAIALTPLPTQSAPTQTPPTASPQPTVANISPQPRPIAAPPPEILEADLTLPLPLENPIQPFEEIERLNNPPEQPVSEPDPVVPDDDPLPATDPAQDTDEEPGVVIQLAADFPHLAGAQSGCYGLSHCHQMSGSHRQVARQLTAQMRAQGYQLTEDDTIDGAGHQVFAVVMPQDPGSLYYLNIFSDGLDSAIYAITVDILSLDELKSLQA